MKQIVAGTRRYKAVAEGHTLDDVFIASSLNYLSTEIESHGQFLMENGFAVPEDISIAGFDDIPMCEMMVPALTTVKQDGALRARIAIEKLQELKDGKIIEPCITLPVTLIKRESTR